MLVALGAGSSVALASQYGRASGQEGEGGTETGEGTETPADDGTTTGQQCTPCIDSYSGYLQAAATKEDGEELTEFEPVLTVEMRVTDADVVFPEQGEGGANGNAGNETGTGTPGDEPGTPLDETGTPAEETGTPPNGTGTATGTPMGGTGTGTPMTGNGTETPMAGGEEVQGFPDFYFDPVGIALQPGDVVEFLTREEIHTVTAFHPRYFGYQQRVPDGVPGFSSPPVLENDSWYYRFDEPGIYDMLCLPHESLGMVMRAVVQEEGDEEVPEEYEELPTGGESGLAPIDQLVLNAPELDPANILEQGTVAWTDLTEVASEPPFGP